MIKQWVRFNHFPLPTAFLLVMSLQGTGLKTEFMVQLSLQKRFPCLSSCPVVLRQEKPAAEIQIVYRMDGNLCPITLGPLPPLRVCFSHTDGVSGTSLVHRHCSVQVGPLDRDSGQDFRRSEEDVWRCAQLQTPPALEFLKNTIPPWAKYS